MKYSDSFRVRLIGNCLAIVLLMFALKIMFAETRHGMNEEIYDYHIMLELVDMHDVTLTENSDIDNLQAGKDLNALCQEISEVSKYKYVKIEAEVIYSGQMFVNSKCLKTQCSAEEEKENTDLGYFYASVTPIVAKMKRDNVHYNIVTKTEKKKALKAKGLYMKAGQNYAFCATKLATPEGVKDNETFYRIDHPQAILSQSTRN